MRGKNSTSALMYWKNLLAGCLGCLLGTSATAHAQNLCNSTTAEKGGFELLTPATGCSPYNVKIKDISGGTDIAYYYFYKGESAANLLPATGTTNLEETYLGSDKPITYTILQKGKKNGKDMYACKNVTVRPDNQPLFSYNSCNNRILNISIPATAANDFDSYKIDWGDGSSIVATSDLPFENTKTYAAASTTKNIKVEGIYNAPSGCAAPKFQTVDMSEGGNYANFSELKLSDDRTVASVIFNALDLPYDLFSRDASGVYPASPLKKVSNGDFDVPVDVSKQYCFSTFRNSGGCFESSGEVCTVPLSEVTPLGLNYGLTWASHPVNARNTLKGSNGLITSVSYNVLRSESNGANPVIFQNVTSPFIDTKADCKQGYCYRVETIVRGYPKFGSSINYESKSISNEICVDRKEFSPSPITDAFTFVEAGNIVISFKDNSDWILKKEKFRLLRFDDGNFKRVDSLKVAGSFTDGNASPDEKPYCYKINYEDECGSTSADSPRFCTVHLTEDKNRLNWTNQNPFAIDSTVTYEIIYFDETTGLPILAAESQPPNVNHTPDLSLFEEVARYQIKAVSTTGKISFSNVIDIPIAAALFVPTAFTPNGDAKNERFEIKGSTKRLKNYNLSVYNRWGESVFSTDDVATSWDGTVNGSPANAGTYNYRLTATVNSGEVISKTGSVLLMR